jgi:hypothetical protein
VTGSLLGTPKTEVVWGRVIVLVWWSWICIWGRYIGWLFLLVDGFSSHVVGQIWRFNTHGNMTWCHFNDRPRTCIFVTPEPWDGVIASLLPGAMRITIVAFFFRYHFKIKWSKGWSLIVLIIYLGSAACAHTSLGMVWDWTINLTLPWLGYYSHSISAWTGTQT